MAIPSMFLGVCLFNSLPSISLFKQAIVSLCSILFLFLSFLVTSEDSVEDSSMEEDDKHPRCQVSIVVSGAGPDAEDPLLSPWPKMAASIMEDDDDDNDDDGAIEIDHKQHQLPQELYLLLDQVQTPAAIQDIVLNALNTPTEKAVLESEVAEASEEPPTGPYLEDVPESSGALQVTSVGSPSDIGHSRSASDTSLSSSSLSTSPTTNSSVDDTISGSKKSIFFTLLSSKTDIIGPMKQAMKDRSLLGKGVTNESSYSAARSL